LSRRAQRISSELALFFLVASAYAAYLLLSGYDRFYHDADAYWRLGKLFNFFDSGGHFSLNPFNDPAFAQASHQGYALPLLNHLLGVVASAANIGSVTIVKVWGSLLATALGVIVLPRLARQLFPAAKIGPGRVLALNGLIFLFWRGHFNFPLSDFPALLLACIATIGLMRSTPVGYVVAGLGFGLSANIRPEYLPALVASIAVAALLPCRPWSWRRRGNATALVLASALIVSLPQVAMNHHNHGTWSPVSASGHQIAMLQLTDGLLAQKYETYIGPPSGYPEPGVFYLDPATSHVLQEEHVSRISSFRQYARIVSRHPIELVASYMRHIFNGLDVRYPTPYIRNLGDAPILLSLLQYTLLFAAIARLVLPDARHALGSIRWTGIIVLLSPCLTAIPGAVEPRFFLPAQILVYMLVCFGPNVRVALFGGQIGRRVALASCYAAFLLVCLTLSSATLAQLEHPGPTLGYSESDLTLPHFQAPHRSRSVYPRRKCSRYGDIQTGYSRIT
jgi:hypothetical protein